MKKTILLIAYILSVFSCKTTKQQIEIKTFESKNEILLWYSTKMSTVWAISLPVCLKITNSTYKKKSFLNYRYVYGNKLKGKSSKMYLIEGNKLIKQSISKIKYIDSKNSKNYLFYSKHFVDTLEFSKKFFEPYIKKMLAEHKDTLHIGSVQEFKQKHKELFEKLTKNDSISIQFLDGKKFGERITVPVEW